ncbi:MAG: hypothetical protein MUF52_11380 [Syntrophobacteraceae bacterium]|jgi:hypothetical protein|nr:hypothetical protein [Syntrophobacteraceae bacterium]
MKRREYNTETFSPEDPMRAFFFALSLAYISLGTMMVLYSDQTRAHVRSLLNRFSLRTLAAVPAAFGVILIVGAFSVREVFGLALILGILGLAKGVYLAFGPLAQIERVRDWWLDEAGDIVVRLTGLVAFLLGAAILSWLV